MAAFGKAGGYTNLNNGVFSSVIYSKQAQIAFRKAATSQAITNSEYFGRSQTKVIQCESLRSLISLLMHCYVVQQFRRKTSLTMTFS